MMPKHCLPFRMYSVILEIDFLFYLIHKNEQTLKENFSNKKE